jgi:lysophospholipase L1-like esterase
MQTINNYGMQLNVNNSYSGSWVTDVRGGNIAACNTRVQNLHTVGGDNPDIIAVFIGTNDLGGGSPGPRPCNQTFDSAFFARVESGTYTSPFTKDGATLPSHFDEGYALMLYKMKTKYPNADVFCCTIPRGNGGRDGELLDKYNNAIKEIAKHYGYSVVDLYSTALSTEWSTYTIDNLHPNAFGMDIITRELEKAMARKYLTE